MRSGTSIDAIREKVDQQKRVTREEAAWLFEHAADADLQDLATRVRSRFHPPGQATYLKMAIVNYTNVCVARCDYCAFYRFPDQPDTYLLSFEQVCQKIDQLRELGGTMVGFNGGFHPDLGVEHYTHLFAQVRDKYPDMSFYEMTVAEFMFVAKRAKRPYDEVARAFAACGTRWITGGGAEVLDDAFRLRHSPGKYKVESRPSSSPRRGCVGPAPRPSTCATSRRGGPTASGSSTSPPGMSPRARSSWRRPAAG